MRYAVAVAQERSFTRAAEQCHVVQSALSHQIKALERELGVALFARTSRRVETTAAGDAFVSAARVALAAAEHAHAAATATAGELKGTLTIGVIPTVTAIDIPALLAAFHRAYPAVKVRLRGSGSDESLAAIAEGGMDVAVLGLPGEVTRKGVASRVLECEELVALVSSRHRLAGRRRLRIGELADETFIDFPEGRPGREQVDLAFAAAGVRREVAFEVTGVELMLGLVRHNLAVTFLSPGVIPADDALRSIPVTDGPTRVEHLAWSGFNPSPATLAFLEFLDGRPG